MTTSQRKPTLDDLSAEFKGLRPSYNQIPVGVEVDDFFTENTRGILSDSLERFIQLPTVLGLPDKLIDDATLINDLTLLVEIIRNHSSTDNLVVGSIDALMGSYRMALLASRYLEDEHFSDEAKAKVENLLTGFYGRGYLDPDDKKDSFLNDMRTVNFVSGNPSLWLDTIFRGHASGMSHPVSLSGHLNDEIELSILRQHIFIHEVFFSSLARLPFITIDSDPPLISLTKKTKAFDNEKASDQVSPDRYISFAKDHTHFISSLSMLVNRSGDAVPIVPISAFLRGFCQATKPGEVDNESIYDALNYFISKSVDPAVYSKAELAIYRTNEMLNRDRGTSVENKQNNPESVSQFSI